MTPIIVPILPTRLTPRTTPSLPDQHDTAVKIWYRDTQGLVAMILKATPERKRLRAARAVRTKPPPVYLKLSFNRDFSATERGSRVSLLKIASKAITAPATPTYIMVSGYMNRGYY